MPQNQPHTTTNPSMCNYTDIATSARISSGIWNTFLASWTTATRGANATVPINFIYACGSKGTGRGLAFIDVYDGKERKQNSYSIVSFCQEKSKHGIQLPTGALCSFSSVYWDIDSCLQHQSNLRKVLWRFCCVELTKIKTWPLWLLELSRARTHSFLHRHTSSPLMCSSFVPH